MSQLKVFAVNGHSARMVTIEASVDGLASHVSAPFEIFSIAPRMVGVCSRYFLDTEKRPERFVPFEGAPALHGNFITGSFVIMGVEAYDDSIDDAFQTSIDARGFDQFGFRDLTEDEIERAKRLLEVGDDMLRRFPFIEEASDEGEPANPVQPMLRVLIFEPGQSGRDATIPNTREAFKEIVGDSLCQFTISVRGLVGMCHDEGYRLGLRPNRYNAGTNSTILGTFFVCGVNPPELTSLTPQQMIAVRALYPDK